MRYCTRPLRGALRILSSISAFSRSVVASAASRVACASTTWDLAASMAACASATCALAAAMADCASKSPGCSRRCCWVAPRRSARCPTSSGPRSTAPPAAGAQYRELVAGEGFVPFFRQVSPVDELSELTIGSRPASRRTGGRLEDLRAIPWVFAWTQNRILLPSWYGAGTALEEGDASASARCGGRGRSSAWPARFARDGATSRSTSRSGAATSRSSTRLAASAARPAAGDRAPLGRRPPARHPRRGVAARRHSGAARAAVAPQSLGRPAVAPAGGAAGALAGGRDGVGGALMATITGSPRGCATRADPGVRLAVLAVVDGRTTRRWSARWSRSRAGVGEFHL